MALILEYPYWFILLCIGIGLVFASILYAKKAYLFHEKENPLIKKILFVLRFLSTSLIAFLLLSPLLKTKFTKEIKPTIVFLQDNSYSMKYAFKNMNVSNYQKKIDALLGKLQDKYHVETHFFDEKISPYKTINYAGKETNIEHAIDQAYALYEHQNIAGIVLATDGIYNVGSNPIYHPLAINKPIFTIGLGDTTIQKDAAINNLLYPEFVYLGDNFNIQIEINANKLNGQNTVLEVLDNNNKIVLQQTININDENFVYNTNVTANANKSGILTYKVRLKLITGEIIKENNFDNAYIEVIDGRQKILLLYDVPHPDVKAFKNTIEQQKNYQIEVQQIDNFKQNFEAFDLVILHGIPSNQSNTNLATLQNLMDSKQSILFVLSAQSNLSAFNQLQKNININGSAINGNDVQILYQDLFSKFIFDKNHINILEQLPPLLAPFGKYNIKSNADILFKQKIGSIGTQNPLLAFFDENGKKTGILAAEGIWRWKLHEYLLNKNTNATDDLINKSVQYLTVKSDKRKFKISSNKKIYNNNERIWLDAQLYNESFILVNEPEVNLKIVDEQKKEYIFVFDKTINAYQLNVGTLPVGNYSAIAKTNYKNNKYEAVIQFSVRAVSLEYTNTQANFSLLKNLSAQSGGQFFLAQDVENLKIAIENNKAIHTTLQEQFSTKPLIDWKLFFGIIVLLLAIEWFVRKYNGII